MFLQDCCTADQMTSNSNIELYLFNVLYRHRASYTISNEWNEFQLACWSAFLANNWQKMTQLSIQLYVVTKPENIDEAWLKWNTKIVYMNNLKPLQIWKFVSHLQENRLTPPQPSKPRCWEMTQVQIFSSVMTSLACKINSPKLFKAKQFSIFSTSSATSFGIKRN